MQLQGMEARNLILRNGVELPRVGLGTYKAGGGDLRTAIHSALSMGIRHVDTASVYKNQDVVGEAIASSGLPRSEVFITSKVSPYEQGTEAATAACEMMLRQLNTDYVDMVLVHWPGARKTAPDSERNAKLRLETWRVLERFHRDGKFRAIGVSNYEECHLCELLESADVLPAANQFECHPRLPQASLRAACADAGIAAVAYASLGQGELLREPAVESAARAAGATPAQVLLRWGLASGCAVIPKTVRPERMTEFTEDALLGPRWKQSAAVSAVDSLRMLDDGHKFCWDPSGIR